MGSACASRSSAAKPGTRCSIRAARGSSARPTAGPTRASAPTRATWDRIAADVRGGMDAFRARKLSVRHDLHLGVGFLAATSGMREDGRLRFRTVPTRTHRLSLLEAGTGAPVIAIHGLGATKASFLATVAALAPRFRVIAIDLPGFGDSDKPVGAAYDARFFADAVVELLDALELDRAHLIGNSLGGRVALEAGLRAPERVDRLALLAPSLAWLRKRPWAPALRLVRPELGLLPHAPRPVVERIIERALPEASNGWAAAGHRRVPAQLPDAARARRVLRRRAPDLPREARRPGRLLAAAEAARRAGAVRLGPARRARADRVRPPRHGRASRRRSTSS